MDSQEPLTVTFEPNPLQCRAEENIAIKITAEVDTGKILHVEDAPLAAGVRESLLIAELPVDICAVVGIGHLLFYIADHTAGGRGRISNHT